MKNSHAFFRNAQCEYFPCHQVNNDENFNCLFCYCPLYHLENCGGNSKMLENGIKDCSNCIVPHKAENYDYIVKKMSTK